MTDSVSENAPPDAPSTAAHPTPTGGARPPGNAVLAAALVIGAILVVWGLSGYGIWDPWELGIADEARHLLAGEPVEASRPPLPVWLVARAFAAFGVHEWSGRAPIALTALLLLLVAAWLGKLYDGRRRAGYAVVVLVSSPLFLLNARHMMGHAPAALGAGLVFACAALLAFPPRSLARTGARLALVAGLAGSVGLATSAAGVLLGVVPPLLAVAAVIVARDGAEMLVAAFDRRRPAEARARALARLGVVAAAVVAVLGTLWTIAANREGYSHWTGGVPRGGPVPTFEVPIEALFHAFAPWSALLPLAVGYAITHGSLTTSPSEQSLDDASSARALDAATVVWIGASLAAQAIHAARYGEGPFLAALGLAWLVASFLRTSELTSRGESWARGLVVLLLVGLLIRDFRGYPGTPVAGLSLRSFSMPDAFNPAGGWAATLGLFGLTMFFALASDPTAKRAPLASIAGAPLWTLRGLVGAGVPIDLVRTQWNRGKAFRAWLVGAGVVLACMLGFGASSVTVQIATRDADDVALLESTARTVRLVQIVAGIVGSVLVALALVLHLRRKRGSSASTRLGPFVAGAIVALGVLVGASALGALGANSLALRIGQVLLVLPVATFFAIGIARLAHRLLTTLGQATFAPPLGAALLLAAWFVTRFHPQASAHFSPREIYDTYNALAASDEPLGEYQVGGRAAAYYARGEVVELRTESDALAFLARSNRVWLALPAEQLAQINRGYRARAQRHLFVADARNARVVLATNQPIPGRADENYLAGFVLDEPPAIEHPVNASFDRRIELLGYDLDLPGGDRVGPGQAFTVTWYWRCVTPVPGGYQPFVHIDGFGQRLNGDHEPVGGRYPVRMWSEGDIVVDRQELRVPANFPPGDYTIYTGLFSGESRLEVVQGPEDEANRVIAGRLRVR